MVGTHSKRNVTTSIGDQAWEDFLGKISREERVLSREAVPGPLLSVKHMLGTSLEKMVCLGLLEG